LSRSWQRRLDPEAYLAYVLERIADHPANCIDDLLPWNVTSSLPSTAHVEPNRLHRASLVVNDLRYGAGRVLTKTIGPLRQVMFRGLENTDQLLTMTMAAYNLTRLRSLAALRPQSA
jgi:hypothetical protein